MKISRVGWSAFRLPFHVPFAAAHGRLGAREGLVLRLVADDGRQGLGEGSPLPALGGGTLEDARAIVGALAPRLLGQSPDGLEGLLADLDPRRPGMAAVACALDTALGDLQAQEAGVSLARLLAPGAAEVVPVNAIIGATTIDQAVTAARAAVDAGFTCVKLKVGLPGQLPRAELARVAAVREALGAHVALRLDANGAWDAATAIAFLGEAARYDLELVEQPVAVGDLGGMVRVRAAVAVPVAADEAARDLASAREVIAAGAADILVVKPMAAGGPRAGLAIIAMARAAGLGVIVTTTLDAGVGTAMALHLAATLPAPARPCGLATGPLLAGDLLISPLVVAGGTMPVPCGPGLGVRLDGEQLARHGGVWEEAGA